MFFYLSKIFYFFAAPTNFLILCGLAGLAAGLIGWRRLARWLMVLALAGLAVIGFSPLSLLVVLPLEERFQPPEPAPDRVDGIIVLGGSVNTIVSSYRDRLTLVDAAERIADTAALARRYPDAVIVYTGGAASIFASKVTEAEVAARYLESFGIERDRTIIEDRALNTWQNAVLSRELARPAAGQTWLLVTSAFHMPRAVGVFRKAGWPGIVAWPVDYRVGGLPDALRMRTNAPLGLQLMDLAVKEWIGLAVYYATGRSSALFPAPG